MRGVVLVGACMLAACDGRGVDLEVGSTIDLDAVELFLVTNPCLGGNGEACAEGIAWSATTPIVRGEIYLQSADDKVIHSTRLEGDKIVMHLEIEDGFEQPTGIVVVGYRGGAIVATQLLWNVTIPRHAIEIWRVELEPTMNGATVEDTVAPRTGEPWTRAQVWARRPPDLGYAGCLALQWWQDGEQAWKTKFVVPAADPDCDGFTEGSARPECNAYWADYNVDKQGINQCVVKDSNTLGDACLLGVAQCEDGVTTSTDCRAESNPVTCVPDEICNRCADDPALASCITSEIRATESTANNLYLPVCALHPSSVNGGPCIAANKVEVSLPPGCGEIVVRPATMPLSGGGGTVTAQGLTFNLTFFNEGTRCVAELQWSGGSATTLSSIDLVLDVAYAMGSRRLLVPVRMNIESPVVCQPGAVAPCLPARTGDRMLGCAM